MATLSPTGIASWPGSTDPSAIANQGVSTSIATTAPQQPAPQWEDGLDALLKLRREIVNAACPDPEAPSREVLEAAMQWWLYLREAFPQAPPTLICPEPGGGLIIERRVRLDHGNEVISELTLYNQGQAEMTLYENGKVTQMVDVAFDPSSSGAT